MLRKLMLVGMLVVAGRGSVAQLFLALVISFVSFSLQVKLTPYRHTEDNVLKAAVEMHIFLVKHCICPVCFHCLRRKHMCVFRSLISIFAYFEKGLVHRSWWRSRWC